MALACVAGRELHQPVALRVSPHQPDRDLAREVRLAAAGHAREHQLPLAKKLAQPLAEHRLGNESLKGELIEVAGDASLQTDHPHLLDPRLIELYAASLHRSAFLLNRGFGSRTSRSRLAFQQERLVSL